MNDPTYVWILVIAGSWCCGLSVFGTFTALGVLGRYMPDYALPPHLRFVTQGMVFWPMAGLFALEFVIDKIPKLDVRWNLATAHLRILGGAALAVLAVWQLGASHIIAAALIGASLAFFMGVVKSAIRVEAIEAGTAMIVSPIASMVEQCLVFATLFPLSTTPILCVVILGFMLIGGMLAAYLIWGRVKEIARQTLFPWERGRPRPL